MIKLLVTITLVSSCLLAGPVEDRMRAIYVELVKIDSSIHEASYLAKARLANDALNKAYLDIGLPLGDDAPSIEEFIRYFLEVNKDQTDKLSNPIELMLKNPSIDCHKLFRSFRKANGTQH